MPRNPLFLAIAYGVTAFAIGFAFGALRELVLIPVLGESLGRLAEFPLVTGVVLLLGLWVGRRAGSRMAALGVGAGATVLLIGIEFGFSQGLMQQSPAEFLAQFDVTRGALFPLGLLAMALAPVVGWRRG